MGTDSNTQTGLRIWKMCQYFYKINQVEKLLCGHLQKKKSKKKITLLLICPVVPLQFNSPLTGMRPIQLPSNYHCMQKVKHTSVLWNNVSRSPWSFDSYYFRQVSKLFFYEYKLCYVILLLLIGSFTSLDRFLRVLVLFVSFFVSFLVPLNFLSFKPTMMLLELILKWGIKNTCYYHHLFIHFIFIIQITCYSRRTRKPTV